ncbi:MAG TPA: FtsX-like permease family protein [Verrucomicrobiae bacterium]|nr:FtsX-like permease family protein [Verrucomicrobiae bacterium]
MLSLALKNLIRRPLRNTLTAVGLAVAVAVLACLSAFDHGYRVALGSEVNRMGLQLMLVPLGCPYDAAARVLKGKELEHSLPESAVELARRDPAVAVAAPLLMVAQARPSEGRADMWVGLDESALKLKPWWQAQTGQKWFTVSNSVILGCDAAEVELRSPGDSFYSPETGERFRVEGTLVRSGTSDDSLFFVPLATAQRMFNQPERLTAVAIRLHDPALLREASQRLQNIPGAQVVTLTEMMGTFLNLVGAVRTLLLSIACVALTASVLGVFNTLLAAVVERTNELCIMRAVGASRQQIVRLITTEALLLTMAGSVAGVALALVAGQSVEHLVKQFVPFAPHQRLFSLTTVILLQSVILGMVVGVLAGAYPAWRASRLHPAEALKGE